MEIEEIIKLYKERYKTEPKSIVRMPGAGSSRRYYLIEEEPFDLDDDDDDVADDECEDENQYKMVATYGDNVEENHIFYEMATDIAFQSISKFLMRGEDPTGDRVAPRVPMMHGMSEDGRCYLQSYHGDVSLMDIISEYNRLKSKVDSKGQPDESNTEDAERLDVLRTRISELVDKAIKMLVDLQNMDMRGKKVYFLNPPFGKREMKWDLNYFKYEFLKPSGIEFDESKLEDDFDAITSNISEYTSEDKMTLGFMYRDFQSRNILVEKGDRIMLIDFQGGRIGPVVYDIVSLLWQAKAAFGKEFKEEKLALYYRLMGKFRGKEAEEQIRALFPDILLIRTLQVLGAYGFRGLVERKAHFLESIYFGLNNLEELLTTGILDKYSELKRVSELLVAGKERFAPPKKGRLTVEVFSFSYKKGYPADYTGNGGGFMFDCRGMHNPGRYEEYKQLTGLDKPVIDFLEKRGEVQEFVRKAFGVVESSIDTYIRRGFSNLQIGFGCTGGQHRSVYCAQHLAELIAEKYPYINIVLNHRERGIVEAKLDPNNRI